MNNDHTQNAQGINELQDLAGFLKQHGLVLAAGLIIVLAAATGIVLYNTNKTREVAQISKSLYSARSVQDLEALVVQHPTSPYAPVAELKIAKSLFDEGNYDAALKKYEEFQIQHPEHELALAAELNKSFCTEARGQIDEAVAGYEAFAKKHPDYFMTPHAIFGQARCRAAMGKIPEARALYEDFIAANPKSPWVNRAEYLLEDLNTRAGIDTEQKPKPATGKTPSKTAKSAEQHSADKKAVTKE